MVGALGFAVGSGLGGAFGWRIAFYAIGLPGIAAALFVLRLQNPPVGVNDERGDGGRTVALVSSGSSSSSSSQKSVSIEVVDRGLSSSQKSITFEVVDSSQNQLHGKTHLESGVTSSSTSPSPESETGVIITVLDLNGTRDWRTRLWLETRVALSELWEILCIKPFLFAVLGSAANSFGSGGLADWLPVGTEAVTTTAFLSHTLSNNNC